MNLNENKALKGLKKYMLRYWYFTGVVVLSIISYISVFISPSFFWPAVFASYAIPGVLILNLILLLILSFFKRKLVVFPVVALVFGLPFILITYSFKGEKVANNHNLSVLSFNAKFFRKPKTYNEFSIDMIKWVAADTSEIKCIQEYSTNSKLPGLDATKQIKDYSYNSFVYKAAIEETENNQGMAIFTKYKILDSGYVWMNKNNFNAALYIDFIKDKDTLRIYNVHLESMRLQLSQYKESDRYQSKLKTLIIKLKDGAEKRSSQIDKLIAHTDKCPYPYIICGDFNETPYSYNYFKLKRNFSNAFEEAGNGFGFSFNSILFFLRIDHHFYNNEIEAIDYRVDRSMKISDHFPTRGYYRLKKE